MGRQMPSLPEQHGYWPAVGEEPAKFAFPPDHSGECAHPDPSCQSHLLYCPLYGPFARNWNKCLRREVAMDRAPIIVRLTAVFQEVFDEETLQIFPTMTARDVEGWDSLSHIRLVVSAEQAFGVRFNTGEISSLENVGEFVDLIESKLANVLSNSE